eukprot:CAMPEP_0172601404 /NCGR_PEP_ID=MMETSP1068-20121228/21549_1 /TAXON_ID=35684 /ORGANISM="Pseudopedinella elastica, Strain CCMP716" /LENGTH=123 /DNA_ID=CAMNT_0013402371 /DNA_START=37 /DNA_END=409 /DNA_ORIENTATION=-
MNIDEIQGAPGFVFKRDHRTPRGGVGGIRTFVGLQGRRGKAGTAATVKGGCERGPHGRGGGAQGRGGEPRSASGEPLGRNPAGPPSLVSTASDFGLNLAGFPGPVPAGMLGDLSRALALLRSI